MGEGRIVGGTVRDIILIYCELAKKTKFSGHNKIWPPLHFEDIDIASTLTPTEIIKKLQPFADTISEIGIQYGTIEARIEKQLFEITTLRSDRFCDGRHADVKFHQEWQEDARRRDFTINGMFLNLNGEVYDYFGGIEDLKIAKVKYIDDPEKRIKEDHLRILRYFRFCGRFDPKCSDKESYKKSIALSNHLQNLSGERIKNEMWKTLKKQFPGMNETEVAYQVFKDQYPELATVLKDSSDYNNEDKTWEEHLIIYSDARTLKNKIVSLSERFDYLMEVYPHKKEMFDKCGLELKKFEQKITQLIKIDPKNIALEIKNGQ